APPWPLRSPRRRRSPGATQPTCPLLPALAAGRSGPRVPPPDLPRAVPFALGARPGTADPGAQSFSQRPIANQRPARESFGGGSTARRDNDRFLPAVRVGGPAHSLSLSLVTYRRRDGVCSP